MRRIFTTVVLTFACAAVAAPQMTAIRAGRVVDPETGNVATNQIILIDREEIKSVGSNVAIPAGTTVIDLSKETVIPGMMDAHAHLCMNTQASPTVYRYFENLTEAEVRAKLPPDNGKKPL